MLILSILFSFCFLLLLYNNNNNDNGKMETQITQVEFNETSKNIEEINVNINKTIEFICENKGKIPLIIYSIETSCSCVKLDYPYNPIKPNESLNIKVNYNSNKVGNFHKILKVFGNFNNSPVILSISGRCI